MPQNTQNTKNSLNQTIRNKIAVQLVLNTQNTHQEIANFYGISRQLVTLIAAQNNLQRTKTKGTEGPDTFPKRPRANFEKINESFSNIDSDKLKSIVNLGF